MPLVVRGPGVRRGGRVADGRADDRSAADRALGARHPASGAAARRDLGPLLAGGRQAAPTTVSPSPRPTTTSSAPGRERLICERRAAAARSIAPTDDPRERHDRRRRRSRSASTQLRGLLREIARDHGRYETARRLARGPRRSARPAGRRRRRRRRRRRCSTTPTSPSGARPPRCSSTFTRPATAPEREARARARRGRRGATVVGARAGADGRARAAARRGAPPRPRPRLEAAGRARARRAGRRARLRRADRLVGRCARRRGRSEANSDGEPLRLSMDLARRASCWPRPRRRGAERRSRRLLRALEDVRARPYVADALGALGDDRARAPLLALLAGRALRARRGPREARALLALGVHDWSPPRGRRRATCHTTLAVAGRAGAARRAPLGSACRPGRLGRRGHGAARRSASATTRTARCGSSSSNRRSRSRRRRGSTSAPRPGASDRPRGDPARLALDRPRSHRAASRLTDARSRS